jgi:ferredoxin-type protein NapF
MLKINKPKPEPLKDPSKRRLFKGRINTPQTLRLPWIISETNFTSACTQCEKCISSCETNIIIKDKGGFPKVDFNLGECSFCNKCIDTCEEPLFTNRFSDENNHKAWPINIEINDTCLAKNNIYCQSCRDECEADVIKFEYHKSSIPQPSLNNLDCTQCGACIKTCPQNAIKTNFQSFKTA